MRQTVTELTHWCRMLIRCQESNVDWRVVLVAFSLGISAVGCDEGDNPSTDVVLSTQKPNGWQQSLTFTGPTRGLLSVTFSPNGELLAQAGMDKSVKIWNVASHQAPLIPDAVAYGLNASRAAFTRHFSHLNTESRHTCHIALHRHRFSGSPAKPAMTLSFRFSPVNWRPCTCTTWKNQWPAGTIQRR
jgi:WD40 repeat protein